MVDTLLFDLDNTLATHKDLGFSKHRKKNKEASLNYYLNAYLYPDTFYETVV